MFTDFIKSDALRRGKAMRPAPGDPTSWMTPGIQPPSNFEQMFQILQSSPGMTPDLLRTILNDHRYKMATKPVFDPKSIVPAPIFTDYRNPV